MSVQLTLLSDIPVLEILYGQIIADVPCMSRLFLGFHTMGAQRFPLSNSTNALKHRRDVGDVMAAVPCIKCKVGVKADYAQLRMTEGSRPIVGPK